MTTESTLTNVLNFTKIEHTAFSLPLIFTGAYLGAGGHFPDASIMLLIVVAAVGARLFGMSMNRVLDRRIDRLNPRTAGRELPAGKMGLAQALGIAGGGLVVYLVACAWLGDWCLMLSPIPLVPLFGYSLLKRFTPLCHFGIGLCLALAPLGAWVAAAGNPHLSGAVLLFAGFVFCWLSGADIIYAIMDIDSDRTNQIHSLPAQFGASGAMKIAAAVHLMAWIILATVVRMVGGGIVAWVALGVTAVFLVMMYVPTIPVPKRFFPISTLAGIAGALAPMVA